MTGTIVDAAFSAADKTDATRQYVALLRKADPTKADVASFRRLCDVFGKSAEDATADAAAVAEHDRLAALAQQEADLAKQVEAAEVAKNEAERAFIESREAIPPMPRQFSNGAPAEMQDNPEIDDAIAASEAVGRARGEAVSRLADLYDRHDAAKNARDAMDDLRQSRRDLFHTEPDEIE